MEDHRTHHLDVPQLFRVAEVAAACPRSTVFADGMGELAVEQHPGRRMFRQFADLFREVVSNDDDDRRRWWILSSHPTRRHLGAGLRTSEPAAGWRWRGTRGHLDAGAELLPRLSPVTAAARHDSLDRRLCAEAVAAKCSTPRMAHQSDLPRADLCQP